MSYTHKGIAFMLFFASFDLENMGRTDLSSPEIMKENVKILGLSFQDLNANK